MKVVTVRDFRDHAWEMFRSDDVVLVTREGTPAGFFLPWDTPELPVEVRREVFLRLSEQIGAALTAKDKRARGARRFRCLPQSSLTRTSSSRRSSAAAPAW